MVIVHQQAEITFIFIVCFEKSKYQCAGGYHGNGHSYSCGNMASSHQLHYAAMTDTLVANLKIKILQMLPSSTT